MFFAVSRSSTRSLSATQLRDPKIRAAIVRQRKRYARSDAERLLLKWVICWVLLAGLATGVMLFLLVKIQEKPILKMDSKMLLELYDNLTRDTYNAKDSVSSRLLGNITTKRIGYYMQ